MKFSERLHEQRQNLQARGGRLLERFFDSMSQISGKYLSASERRTSMFNPMITPDIHVSTAVRLHETKQLSNRENLNRW